MSISNTSHLRVRFDDQFRGDKVGTYPTSPGVATTYYDTVVIEGNLDYTRGEEAQLKDLRLALGAVTPRIQAWSEHAGTHYGSLENELKFVEKLTLKDVSATKYKGRTFRIEFLPGRRVKSISYNTENGKLKINRGFFSRSWTTRCESVNRLA